MICLSRLLSLDSHTNGDGDVKVAAGNLQRKEVVGMCNDFYTAFGYIAFWVMKYIAIPIGVGVMIKLITHKILQPQPERQRKKRLDKNRLKLNPLLKT